MEENKKTRRISGMALRAAARLMETRGANQLLYPVAARQLGLDQLWEIDVPTEAAPYRPLHLGSAAAQGGRHD
jgi:hypothetical protein